MRFHDVMTTRWWRKKIIGGTFVLLGLAGIALPNSGAQSPAIEDDRRSPEEPSGISGEGAMPAYYSERKLFSRKNRPSRTPSPPVQQPPSISPDNDYYPSPARATVPVTRSYYYAGGDLDRTAPPPAAPLPLGVGVAALPWNQEGFKEYEALAEVPQELSRSLPRKYTLEAVPLARGAPIVSTAAAVLVVHLPEYALLWVEGKRIRLGGPTNSLASPPLSPAGRYRYTVRAAWLEDGQWVSQTRKVPVQAGLVQAIYLRSH